MAMFSFLTRGGHSVAHLPPFFLPCPLEPDTASIGSPIAGAGHRPNQTSVSSREVPGRGSPTNADFRKSTIHRKLYPSISMPLCIKYRSCPALHKTQPPCHCHCTELSQ